MVGFGEAARRPAFHAARVHEAEKGRRREPGARALRREVAHQMRHLALPGAGGDWHEQVRLAEVALVLRHLVLENQVPAPGLPGQLGDDPVILVTVLQAVAENEVRSFRRFQRLECFFRLAEMRGEMSVLELVQNDFHAARSPEQGVRAAPGFIGALPASAHHHFDARVGMQPLQDRSPAPDLQVVAVRAEAKESERSTAEVERKP
jgi:hypothetical protein